MHHSFAQFSTVVNIATAWQGHEKAAHAAFFPVNVVHIFLIEKKNLYFGFEKASELKTAG